MNYEELIEGAKTGLLGALQEIEKSKDIPDDLRAEAVNVIITWPRDPEAAIRRALQLAANVGAHGAGFTLDPVPPPDGEPDAAQAVARVEAQEIVAAAHLEAEADARKILDTAEMYKADAEAEAEKVRAATAEHVARVEAEATAEATRIVEEAVEEEGDKARGDAAAVVAQANADADRIVTEAQQLATEAAASITQKAEEQATAVMEKAEKKARKLSKKK